MTSPPPHGPLGHHIDFDEDKYPFWKAHFSDEDRRMMVEEDLRAGESVSIELFSIVSIGLVLAVGVVVYCQYFAQ